MRLVTLLTLAAAACHTSPIDYPPGETFRLAGPDPLEAELKDVGKVDGRKVTAKLVLRNPGTRTISFKRARCELHYKGAKLYARDLGWTGHEHDVDLPPGATKEKYWAFHTEEDPVPGTYDLVISGIVVQDGAERRPAGHDLTIAIKVP
jgi:hypothetical protein